MSIRVAICGIDGAGKTTLIDKLYGYYNCKNIDVKIAKVDFLCKETCRSAFIDDRFKNEQSIITRVGMAYDFVNYYRTISDYCGMLICDRYDICYRVLNRVDNLPPRIIERLDKIYSLVQDADIYIYLDLSIEEAASRLDARGNREDNECCTILSSMRNFYMAELKNKKNVTVIQASQTPEKIFEKAKEIICRYGGMQI